MPIKLPWPARARDAIDSTTSFIRLPTADIIVAAAFALLSSILTVPKSLSIFFAVEISEVTTVATPANIKTSLAIPDQLIEEAAKAKSPIPIDMPAKRSTIDSMMPIAVSAFSLSTFWNVSKTTIAAAPTAVITKLEARRPASATGQAKDITAPTAANSTVNKPIAPKSTVNTPMVAAAVSISSILILPKTLTANKANPPTATIATAATAIPKSASPTAAAKADPSRAIKPTNNPRAPKSMVNEVIRNTVLAISSAGSLPSTLTAK